MQPVNGSGMRITGGRLPVSPTSSVFIAQAPGAANPRSYSPGAPIAGTVGVRATF